MIENIKARRFRRYPRLIVLLSRCQKSKYQAPRARRDTHASRVGGAFSREVK